MEENPMMNQLSNHKISNHASDTVVIMPFDIEHTIITSSSSSTSSISSPLSYYNLLKKHRLMIYLVCMISTFIIVFGIMLSTSIIQSQSAAQAPETLLANPQASINNWDTYYYDVPDSEAGSFQNTPSSMYFGDQALTLEVVFSDCQPQNTGALISTLLTLYIPYQWFDYSVTPPKPYFTTSCIFGESLIEVTPTSTISDQSTSIVYNLRAGSYLQYPFDTYSQKTNFYCAYDVSSYNIRFNRSITPVNNYFNFNIRIAKPDVGLFTHIQQYHKVGIYTGIQYITDNNITVASNYTYYSYPYVDLTFTRATINRVFPMYLTIAMWMIVMGQTLVFYPFYVGMKVVDSNSIPMAAVGVLFALPNIRNNLPGAPPVGAVIDFGAYFWCLIIAILHFLCISIFWVEHTVAHRVITKKD